MTEIPSTERTGQCLCGAAKFSLTLKNTAAHVCHCSMCRKWGAGGPVISVDCESSVKISDPGAVSWYQSSENAQRGFCKSCGSSLFYRLTMDDVDYMNVCVGLLDDQDGLHIKDHIFIDAKPPYYDFADDRPRLTEKEFLAQFEEFLK